MVNLRNIAGELIDFFFFFFFFLIERMTVLGRGLIFQPVLVSLPYTQACTI